MRILRLMLKNYVGIYAGMGLHEIDIDFSKCAHKICIIRGDNGSGKSTILKALSPINDSSKDYLEGYERVKNMSENEREELIHYTIGPDQLFELDKIKEFLKVNKFKPLK